MAWPALAALLSAAFTLWIAAALVLALLIGGMIRLRDSGGRGVEGYAPHEGVGGENVGVQEWSTVQQLRAAETDAAR